jgi:hypothetical protein
MRQAAARLPAIRRKLIEIIVESRVDVLRSCAARAIAEMAPFLKTDMCQIFAALTKYEAENTELGWQATRALDALSKSGWRVFGMLHDMQALRTAAIIDVKDSRAAGVAGLTVFRTPVLSDRALAIALCRSGDVHSAVERLNAAAENWRRLGERAALRQTLSILGSVFLGRGSLTDALKAMAEEENVFLEDHDPRGLGECLWVNLVFHRIR